MNSPPRTTQLPTAAQVAAQIANRPSPPPGMVLNVFPPTREYMSDPFWYDTAGRDVIQQRHIFDGCKGEEQKEKLKEVLNEFPSRGRWVLRKAAQEGYADAIISLLELGVSLAREDNEDENHEFAPLHIAAFYGNLECVKALVKKGKIEVNARDGLDSTPLLNAARGGHLSTVQWLLEHDADPIAKRDPKMINILQSAAVSGNTDVFRTILGDQRIIDAGIKLDNVISFPAGSGNIEMLKLVLERAGFSIDGDNTRDKLLNSHPLTSEQVEEFERGLWRATTKSAPESLCFLLAYLTDRNLDGSFQYYECKDKAIRNEIFNETIGIVEKDDTEWFETVWNSLLNPPQSVLDSNPEGKAQQQEWLHRRLITAAGAGALQMTKLLLERYKADVNHISIKYHATPLFNAAAQGHVEVVRYLLESDNVDIHLGNGNFANGPTALHNAVLNAHENVFKFDQVVRLLLKHGGPLESFNEAIGTISGSAKLFIVALKKYRAPVELLNEEQREQRRDEIDSKGRALELAVDETDQIWLQNLQMRRRDERLKVADRELMTVGDIYGEPEKGKEENGQESRSDDDEPALKRIKRLGWLERMGLNPVE
ncbi:ankyrin [Stipitochalara longipes BDJ]|nr:ankyrin [Stipitochalara longipes BDJ]